jgi:hypothetical protein
MRHMTDESRSCSVANVGLRSVLPLSPAERAKRPSDRTIQFS